MSAVSARQNGVESKPEEASGVSPSSQVSGAQPSEPFVTMIPRDFAREHLIVSEGRDGTSDSPIERLAIAESTDPAAVFNVGVRLDVAIETEVRDGEEIARVIDVCYAAVAEQQAPDVAVTETDASELDELILSAERDLLSTSGKGPVVRLVDAVLFEALGRGASDVHVQPLEGRTLVRYRVDGVLHTARELSQKLTPALVSRIKVMGRMDIAERRVPQDGRATVTIGSGETARSIDLRISSLPTSHGERVVLRLLESERGEHLAGLEVLGMPRDVREPYLNAASRSNGIVLVTGPTGSGKTTTLYATLRYITRNRENAPGGAGLNGPADGAADIGHNGAEGSGLRSGNSSGGENGAGNREGCELNVMTIEDPIEYELSAAGIAISQAQVNDKKGVAFSTGLRHILRQDPDVIMIGEIRDVETARIAIQASLTGHLVFSTLHTNDASGAVTRLIDLGVEPYLVSASLSAVLAQRLVRKVHNACEGAGCDGCFGSGYAGRTGVYELLQINEGLRELIAMESSLAQLRAAAKAGGMVTLAEAGAWLVHSGVTSQLEVDRVVQATT